MDTDLEFELGLVRRRFVTAWVAVAVVGVLMVASLAWAFTLQAAASRHERTIATVAARVDSLQRVASADIGRIDPIEERIESLGAFEDRLRGAVQAKADRRLDAISNRVRTWGRHAPVRDAVTIVTAGMVIAHTANTG